MDGEIRPHLRADDEQQEPEPGAVRARVDEVTDSLDRLLGRMRSGWVDGDPPTAPRPRSSR